MRHEDDETESPTTCWSECDDTTTADIDVFVVMEEPSAELYGLSLIEESISDLNLSQPELFGLDVLREGFDVLGEEEI